MRDIGDATNLSEIDKEALVERLKKEAVLQNFGRLLNLLINLFTKKKFLKKLGKREGQEVQINFEAFDMDPNCLTFVLSENPGDPYVRPSDNPRVIVTFNMDAENLLPSLIEIVTTKYPWGIFKLVFKYFLTGKIKYKPLRRIRTVFSVIKCFLIGNHEMFKTAKEIEKNK